MAGVGFSNALGWAQFRLRGAARNIAVTTLAYVIIIGGLIVLSVRTDPRNIGEILTFWTYALMVIQSLTLGVYAWSSIRSAIRKDLASGMMESHRLMPISGTEAVAGYMMGSTCQAVSIAAANLVIGLFTCRHAALAPQDWVLANVLIAIFMGCSWTAVALLSFLTQAALAVLVVLGILSVITGGSIISLLPGLTVLFGPPVRQAVQSASKGGHFWTLAFQVSLCSQFAVAILCFIGAVRKFRRDDVLAFGPLLGLVLVALWATLSVVGIVAHDEFQAGFLFGGSGSRDVEVQIIASLIATILIAVIPVSAAAWQSTDYHRRKLLRDPYLGRRPVMPLPIVLAASVIVTLLPALVVLSWPETSWSPSLSRPFSATAYAFAARVRTFGTGDLFEQLLRTGISVAATLLAISYLLQILYRVTRRTAVMVGMWVLATWLGPLVLDFVRFAAMGMRREDEVFTILSGCSPLGSAMLLWGRIEAGTTLGLIVQVAYAVVLGVLFHSTQKRRSIPEARAASLKVDGGPGQ